MAATPDCIFCRIARKQASASIIHEDEDTMSFMDIRPINLGHALVIPKRHAATLATLPLDLGGQVFQRAMAVAEGLRRSGIRCEAVNLHLADGEAAGQEIDHVHIHVIPRFAGDGFGFRVAPGYGRMPDRTELDANARTIQAAMSRQ